ANSARSNYPLGVPVKEIKTAGSLRIGKIHHDSFNVDFCFVHNFLPKLAHRVCKHASTCCKKNQNFGINNICDIVTL
ncbi:MAG: hypothetical protein II415_06530, partial [Bacteroidaceae bacterium]|nr:hypothetical protein [Bacteroidaceae bacterium]